MTVWSQRKDDVFTSSSIFSKSKNKRFKGKEEEKKDPKVLFSTEIQTNPFLPPSIDSLKPIWSLIVGSKKIKISLINVRFERGIDLSPTRSYGATLWKDLQVVLRERKLEPRSVEYRMSPGDHNFVGFNKIPTGWIMFSQRYLPVHHARAVINHRARISRVHRPFRLFLVARHVVPVFPMGPLLPLSPFSDASLSSEDSISRLFYPTWWFLFLENSSIILSCEIYIYIEIFNSIL